MTELIRAQEMILPYLQWDFFQKYFGILLDQIKLQLVKNQHFLKRGQITTKQSYKFPNFYSQISDMFTQHWMWHA